MTDVTDKIVQIIARECELDTASVRPESTLDDLGISSVDLVQVMFQIEEEFDIYLADEQIGFDVENVGQVIEAVQRLVSAKPVGA